MGPLFTFIKPGAELRSKSKSGEGSKQSPWPWTGSDVLFSREPAAGGSEQMRKIGGGSLCYGSLVRKCQFSDHVEILFSVDCELDQDMPVRRDKVSKTNPWVRE